MNKLTEVKKRGGKQKHPQNVNGIRAKLWRAMTNPWWLGGFLLRKISPLIKNDELFIKWEYFFGMKRFPDLEHPKTYNEKLNWMKLHHRRAEYTTMVDKAEVKAYVTGIIGEEHVIPTLGVWNTFDDVDFGSLPKQFVLKTTHDSGGVVIVKDKDSMDKKAAKRKLTKSLCHNFYLEHREYPYKDVKPRIIAEKYMVDESGTELKDYKFFCFNGEPKMLFVATDRPRDTHFDFFDIDFNHLPFEQGHPNTKKKIAKPEKFENMVMLSRKLSQGLPQVRVDLYNINGQIYFGELTFFHFSGNVPFVPDEWDERIGSWWKIDIENDRYSNGTNNRIF